MRIAVIGAGSMGSIYSRIVAENPFLELAAIIGNRPEAVDRLARKYSTKAYYDGKTKAALRTEPDLDAIILATPEWVRLDSIHEVLQAKKHILYEKPLAANYDEAKKLYALFQEANHEIVSMPVFNLRFLPQFADGYIKVRNDDIGEIRHISSRRNGNRNIANRIIGRISPFFWLSPHEMDLVRWFTGDEVEWVEAIQYEGKDKLDGYLLAHLHLSGGVNVQHMVSWCTPKISGIANQSIFDVYGTKGILQLNETAPQGMVFQENNHVDVIDIGYAPIVQNQQSGPFKDLIDHFVSCIRDGANPSITIDDAFASVRICAAMELSFNESRRVFLEELS